MRKHKSYTRTSCAPPLHEKFLWVVKHDQNMCDRRVRSSIDSYQRHGKITMIAMSDLEGSEVIDLRATTEPHEAEKFLPVMDSDTMVDSVCRYLVSLAKHHHL